METLKEKFIDLEIGTPCIFDGEQGFFYVGFDKDEGERFACWVDDSTDIRVFPRNKKEIISIEGNKIKTIYYNRNSTGPFYQMMGPRGYSNIGSELYEEVKNIIRRTDEQRR